MAWCYILLNDSHSSLCLSKISDESEFRQSNGYDGETDHRISLLC